MLALLGDLHRRRRMNALGTVVSYYHETRRHYMKRSTLCG